VPQEAVLQETELVLQLLLAAVVLHAFVLHLTAFELQLAAAALKERIFSAEKTTIVGFKYLNIL
jgi:hypothetical protein